MSASARKQTQQTKAMFTTCTVFIERIRHDCAGNLGRRGLYTKANGSAPGPVSGAAHRVQAGEGTRKRVGALADNVGRREVVSVGQFVSPLKLYHGGIRHASYDTGIPFFGETHFRNDGALKFQITGSTIVHIFRSFPNT